jgi:hypothetical protein
MLRENAVRIERDPNADKTNTRSNGILIAVATTAERLNAPEAGGTQFFSSSETPSV